MATPPATAKPAHRTAADTTAAVDQFMATLDHPFKAEIQVVRELMLAADPRIGEGIKWNAPSFRTSEYFATTHLRAKAGLALIFHLGAKRRDSPADGVVVDDPRHLLQWLGEDRAMVQFYSAADFAAKKGALKKLVQQWIKRI